jgi:hypothetical protein
LNKGQNRRYEMGKSMKWVAVTLAAAAVAAIGIGAAVASAATPPVTGNTADCSGAGGAGWRFGGAVVDEAVTRVLEMTADEVRDLRQEGQSLVEIAAARNVTPEALVAAIMEHKTAQVQSRVTAGTLTQEQANLMIQRMEQQTEQAITRTTAGPMGGQGAGHGQRGGNGTGSCTGQGNGNRGAR